MSRTDKDRPWWVARIQESNIIEHDHRKGVCIEETVETARAFANGGFGRRGYHYRNCKKTMLVTEYCTKKDPHRDWHGVRTCWTTVCACPIPDTWKREWHGCENRVRVQCVGHAKRYRDDTIPCVCDTWPANPTCDIAEATGHRYRWYSGGAPSEFVRSVYHRPERARERQLNDARRLYNAGEDIEDFDFENRQARGSARWLWW